MSDLASTSDEQLARDSQAGCLKAFEELVYRYERRIYGFVAQFCGAVDATEITQDAFVRAFQAIHQFDSRQPFAPWLFTIARRKCADHFRTAPPWDDRELPELPDENDPAELLARQEEKDNLWALARCRLPRAQFEALWLRYAEEMSVAEIARVVRKTRTHVKVLLFRARQSLRRELKPQPAAAKQKLFPERIYEKLACKI